MHPVEPNHVKKWYGFGRVYWIGSGASVLGSHSHFVYECFFSFYVTCRFVHSRMLTQVARLTVNCYTWRTTWSTLHICKILVISITNTGKGNSHSFTTHRIEACAYYSPIMEMSVGFRSWCRSSAVSHKPSGRLSLLSAGPAVICPAAEHKVIWWKGQDTSYTVPSVPFNGHFPGESGLAGTRMSPFWIILEHGWRIVYTTPSRLIQ